MTDKQMAAVIQGVIDPSIYDGPHRGLTFDEALEEVLGTDYTTVSSVSTLEEAGVITGNAGLVVRMSDGTEFQITVVRVLGPTTTTTR